MNSVQLLPAIRDLYSRHPEMYDLEVWELQSALFVLGHTEDLADEAEIAAPRHACSSEARRAVGSIDSRLSRLEDSEAGHSEACPACGLAPDERRPIAVLNRKYPERSFRGDPKERCSTCGQPLWTVIRMVYGDEERGGGRR